MWLSDVDVCVCGIYYTSHLLSHQRRLLFQNSRRLFWNNRPTAIRQKKGERLRERETPNLSPNLI